MAVKVFTGKKPSPAGSSKFTTVKPDEALTFALMIPLAELVSVDLHSFWDRNPAVHAICIGNDCPACAAGNKTGYKAYLPIQRKDGTTGIFPVGLSIVRQLTEIEEELGSLKGKVIKVKRTGAGLGTKYTVVPLGTSITVDETQMPDILRAIAPIEEKAIIDHLAAHGIGAPESTGVSVAAADAAGDDSDWGE